MKKSITYMGRTALTVCAAVAVLAQVGTASALSLDIEDITDLRMERKKANASGKLPLPGTPDLDRLDERLAEQGVALDAPLFIRVFKAESEMEVWTGDENGNYRLFATYPICYWSGTLGPKQREGDKQAPEGFYAITMEQSIHKGTRWPKSLNVGYPNAFDKVNLRSGSYILIHGGCASIGCFAMTNKVSHEVYKLATQALEAGQSNIPIHVFPFRMTEGNLAKYDAPDWRGFWANLKEGYDLFERTHRPPRVSVCGTRYGFTPASRIEAANPGPIEVCPETAQVIADLSRINKRVAEQPEPKTETAEIKTASLAGPASYLGGPATAAIVGNRLGENFEQHLAPRTPHAGVSETLTRQLPCSLALPSCRRYAALREQIAHKVTLKLEEPEREKARSPKKKKKSAKKKRRNRSYSEVTEYRSYRSHRSYRSSRYID
ncbi:MAG: murein L,D-transpeptidase family protein [Hyphomicrobium sp.]